jgi:hypothetical protein
MLQRHAAVKRWCADLLDGLITVQPSLYHGDLGAGLVLVLGIMPLRSDGRAASLLFSAPRLALRVAALLG